MEHGPLPPHERSWRHPSELGPTRAEADASDGGGRIALTAFAGGTVAVVAVALLVVAMTPRTSTGPIALSATTTPIIARASIEPPLLEAPTSPARSMQLASNQALLASFSAFPHSVTRTPQLDLDGASVADELPLPDDAVMVRTEAVTYEMQWRMAQSMVAPDGSVVFDDEGEVIARVADGELVSLVDD